MKTTSTWLDGNYAPVTEEVAKGLGVLLIFLAARREFNGVTDGIVYAGIVAAGFAFVENILYLGRSFAEDGALIGQNGGVLAVLILRGLFSPFAHPLFTSMIGIGCGLAATSCIPVLRPVYVLVGYLLAVVAVVGLVGIGARACRRPGRHDRVD